MHGQLKLPRHVSAKVEGDTITFHFEKYEREKLLYLEFLQHIACNQPELLQTVAAGLDQKDGYTVGELNDFFATWERIIERQLTNADRQWEITKRSLPSFRKKGKKQ